MVEEEAEAKHATCLYRAHTYVLLPALHDRADGFCLSLFHLLALYSSVPLVSRTVRRRPSFPDPTPPPHNPVVESPGGAKWLSTGNGGMSGMSAGVTRNEVIAAIGVILAACVATVMAVHRLDQDKADAEVKRVEGEAEDRTPGVLHDWTSRHAVFETHAGRPIKTKCETQSGSRR